MSLNSIPPYNWFNLRHLLALELCRFLHSKSNGDFVASYDTGAVAFYFRGDVLLLPEDDPQYYSSYPLPFAEQRFAALPPV